MEEEGKKIRKAFIPSNDLFVSIDYSQIELRILSHMAANETLISAFKQDKDIHTKISNAFIFRIDKDFLYSIILYFKRVI